MLTLRGFDRIFKFVKNEQGPSETDCRDMRHETDCECRDMRHVQLNGR